MRAGSVWNLEGLLRLGSLTGGNGWFWRRLGRYGTPQEAGDIGDVTVALSLDEVRTIRG